jgi:hypothetical protein
MRKLNKYKKTLRIFPRGVSLKKISSRILNFRRPKWNFLQEKFSKHTQKLVRSRAYSPKPETIRFSSKKPIVFLWKRLVGSITFNDPISLFLYSTPIRRIKNSDIQLKSCEEIQIPNDDLNYCRPNRRFENYDVEWLWGEIRISGKGDLKIKRPLRPGIKKDKKVIINPLLVIKSFALFERKIRYYKNIFETKTALSNIYGNSISFNKLEKNVRSLKKYNILNYLIKPHYQINILLSNLQFFSTPFQASQEISNKKVLVNDKIINFNINLKKGDVITFTRKSPFRYFKCFLQSYSFDSRLFSFIEADYETETIIVIKDFFDLSLEDFRLLIKDSIQLKNLTYL